MRGRSRNGSLSSNTPRGFLGQPKGLLLLLGAHRDPLGPAPPYQIFWRRSIPWPYSNLHSVPLTPWTVLENTSPGRKGPYLLITWVREAKPGSLAQHIAFGVSAGQVPIGGGGRRKGVGDCEHEAEKPGEAERQQHLQREPPSLLGPEPQLLPTQPRGAGPGREGREAL